MSDDGRLLNLSSNAGQVNRRHYLPKEEKGRGGVPGAGGVEGMTTIRVAAIQLDIAEGAPDVNRRQVGRLVKEALSGYPRAEVLVLPETWTTGYSRRVFSQVATYAESIDGPSVRLLQ